MTAKPRHSVSSWRPEETRAYAKNCQMSNGTTVHDQVRVYSSCNEVSVGRRDPNCNHTDKTANSRLCNPTCDIYDDIPAPAQRRKSHANSRTPEPVKCEKVNGSVRSPFLSSNHVTLSVPGGIPRHKRSPSPIRSNGDDANSRVPSAYPIKSNGSSFSCLTAEIPLSHIDFWPACRQKALMACDAKFERFEALVTRANKWLQQFRCYEVVSCETVDKKVIYVKDIYNAAMYFMDEDSPSLATHIKGLRLWYRHSAINSASSPQELGFLDVTPRYLNPGEKHPRFETLPQTIEKINTRLSRSPLPGEVLSVETVCLKIARDDWSDHIKVDPSHCQWYDEFNTHLLNFIRVFYLISTHYHSQQIIGIQDFTPDALDEGGIFHPAKYASFSVLFRQATTWLQNNPNVRVTNFQSLDTKHRKKSENHGHRFNTEKMFEYRIEERFRAFFLRVGYVLRSRMIPGEIIPGIDTSLACRMYLPDKKTTGYENITEMLQRVENVVETTGAAVYHVETVPVPEWLTRSELFESGDLERMFFDGEWFFVSDQDGNDRGPYRYTLIYAIRVYFDGLPMDYGMTAPTVKTKSCCVII